MTDYRAKLGAIVQHTVTIDGYPSGAPSIALTLPDGSSWSPDGGVTPVHAARDVSAIASDRRTLTLTASVSTDAVARHAGDVFILLERGVHRGRLSEADGTRAVLVHPLPGTETPASIAWARHTFTTDPADNAGDGPGAAVGVLDGVLSYDVLADGATETRRRAVSLTVEERVFWTGLTVHRLHEATAGIPTPAGGNTAETENRYGDHQGVIESTLGKLRIMVEQRVRAAGRLATVVSGLLFEPHHLLMCRIELATDATWRAELRAQLGELLDAIVEALPVDTDGDGVVDGEIAGGYRSPAVLGYGMPTTTSFTRGMIR